MIIEMDGFIFSEDSVKVLLSHGVRMTSMGSKNHEICNIDNSNSQLWHNFSKKSCCCNHFKCHFCANSANNNVWTDAAVGGCKGPDRRSSLTMAICLFGSQPYS